MTSNRSFFTFFHSLAIAAVMLTFTGSPVFADPLTLIEDGQPRAEIIIAEKPPRMVNLAAFELQRYLHKITKVRLPIVHELPAELRFKSTWAAANTLTNWVSMPKDSSTVPTASPRAKTG